MAGGGGKGRREWRESGGGREQPGGGRAERELTPLPRHQIASFSPLSPSRGSVSAAASPLPPPLPGRRKETCRGWRVGVGQGSEGEREFIIGGVRMQGGGPRAYARRGGGGGGKWRARWKKERRSQKRKERKKKETKRPAREATKRFVTPRIPAYTRATESYARIPKEDSPPPRRLRSLPFPPPAIFPFCLLLFLFSAPSRAHARFHLLSR